MYIIIINYDLGLGHNTDEPEFPKVKEYGLIRRCRDYRDFKCPVTVSDRGRQRISQAVNLNPQLSTTIEVKGH